jgi:hypothetical protein
MVPHFLDQASRHELIDGVVLRQENAQGLGALGTAANSSETRGPAGSLPTGCRSPSMAIPSWMAKEKVLPRSGALSTQILPCISLTSFKH